MIHYEMKCESCKATLHDIPVESEIREVPRVSYEYQESRRYMAGPGLEQVILPGTEHRRYLTFTCPVCSHPNSINVNMIIK